MSEVSMYELEDIIDYGESKNHIAPKRVPEVVDAHAVQGACVMRQFSAGIKTTNISTPKKATPAGEEASFPVSEEGKALLSSRDSGTNSGLYNFPFTDMYQANEDLNIFGNKHDHQECSFLSYDEWPNTSYIEDLDGLLRSQNYTFGKENDTNDDEISCFTRSSNAIDGSNDSSEQGLKSFFSDSGSLNRSSKDHENDENHVPCNAIPDYDGRKVSSSYSTMDHSFYGSPLETNSESMSEHISEKETLNVNASTGDSVFPTTKANSESSENDTLIRKQIKKCKQTEPKRNDRKLESSTWSSFIVPSATSQQLVNPTKMPSDSSPNSIALPPEKDVEKLYWKHHMEEGFVSHAAFTDQAHLEKQMQQTQDGVGYPCETDNGSIELPDLDTDQSVLFENSGVSSLGSDKISVEETNFLQLQYTMGQLDSRSKLCIRDSLYRLARSAEQRNKMEHSMSSSRQECGGHAESNNCTVFMDVERDTNPIDRSIAHLLFHRLPEGISSDSRVSANFKHLFDHEIVY